MLRFIVERNIERFERALRAASDSVERKVIERLLAAARRELADLDRDESVSRRSSPMMRSKK